MTDAQRHLFANKMSEMPEMSKYSQGTESYQQFAIRIAEMLLQPEKFRALSSSRKGRVSRLVVLLNFNISPIINFD